MTDVRTVSIKIEHKDSIYTLYLKFLNLSNFNMKFLAIGLQSLALGIVVSMKRPSSLTWTILLNHGTNKYFDANLFLLLSF